MEKKGGNCSRLQETSNQMQSMTLDQILQMGAIKDFKTIGRNLNTDLILDVITEILIL